jgi:hypothetical protein
MSLGFIEIMKMINQLLLIVVCIICVSFTLLATNEVVLSQSSNLDTKKIQGDQPFEEQERSNKMTIQEQQRILLLKQDYQGALDLMPQLEKELLAEELRDKELLAKGKLEGKPFDQALRTIRSTYCYLYKALGREKEALQIILEIELPITTDPELLYDDSMEKILVLGRLNMIDEIIDEINTCFNDPNIGQQTDTLPHAVMLYLLINAKLIKGDIESAQKSIDQMRNNLRRWPTHMIKVLQEHAKNSEMLSYVEYYINNLTETHMVRIVKREWKPPIQSPYDPKKIILDSPGIAFECVSKTDGSYFTVEDFRKIQAKKLQDQDPFLVPQPTPQ